MSFRNRYVITATIVAMAVVSVYLPDTLTRRILMEDVEGGPAQTTPNIVLMVLSQWRYDWDGLHSETIKGNLPLDMPFLRTLAERGTRFTQAYSPSPLDAPAKACLAVGKEYDKTGVYNNHPNDFPRNQDTFYKLLRDVAGYHTMSAGKDDLYMQDPRFPLFPGSLFPPIPFDLGFSDARRSTSKVRAQNEGDQNTDLYRSYLEVLQVDLNHQSHQGTEVYQDCFDGKFGPENLCTSDTFIDRIHPDDFVRTSALELLSTRPRNKPYFLQVNFPGPQFPNIATKMMAASVKDRVWPPPFDNNNTARWDCPPFTGTPQLGGRCNYGGELERIDELMHSIVNMVNPANTIVCVMGDHGEMLGDHGQSGKKVPWQPSIAVPLVCEGPGILPNKVYNKPVATLDLVGTILQLAGIVQGPHMTTQSLYSTLFEGQPPPREVVHTALYDWKAIIKEVDGVSYKLVCCLQECPNLPTGTPLPNAGQDWHILLYDTLNDPNDMKSLHLEKPHVVEQLRRHFPGKFCHPEDPEKEQTLAPFHPTPPIKPIDDPNFSWNRTQPPTPAPTMTQITLHADENITLTGNDKNVSNITIIVELPDKNITIKEEEVSAISIAGLSGMQGENETVAVSASEASEDTVEVKEEEEVVITNATTPATNETSNTNEGEVVIMEATMTQSPVASPSPNTTATGQEGVTVETVSAPGTASPISPEEVMISTAGQEEVTITNSSSNAVEPVPAVSPSPTPIPQVQVNATTGNTVQPVASSLSPTPPPQTQTNATITTPGEQGAVTVV